MSVLKSIASVCLVSLVSATVVHSVKRERYWRPIMEDIAERAGSGPITKLQVLPLKGCGWSFGETIYGEMEMQGTVKTEFLMCRSRHGVRFDMTTHESRWIR